MFSIFKKALKKNVKDKSNKKEQKYPNYINAVKYPSVFLLGLGNQENNKKSIRK